ncbi:hypothetical protein LPLAFNJD_LOCUS3498 [Methylorubrum aminovorans]
MPDPASSNGGSGDGSPEDQGVGDIGAMILRETSP